MKKYLLLFTSAALLLVGCAKEQLSNGVAGELTNVTFTANLDNGVVTKALADEDGAAANVNRCIMEIYYGDTFYKRLVQPVTNKVATFANVPVVAGKQYTVLFWADCGGDNNADKYYMTNGPDSLKAVTVNMDEFINALQNKKNDELDAFFFAGNYTVKQGDASYNDIKLHRPFAQLNVITTDVATDKAVISADLLPEKVSVNYKAANIINVATGEVSGNVDYEYVASVYGKYENDNWNAVKTRGELTLSMDYVLAAADKGAIDVEFKVKNGGADVLTHNLTNLPYQRNYRTNVKGDLLTVGGTWTATIEPTWSTPDYDMPYYVASSITDAQNYISNQNTEQAKSVDLTKAEIKQGDVKEDGTIHFILKTTSPQDLVNFTLPAIPAGIDAQGWTIEYENNYPTKNVGVNAPANTKVKILAPTSHVNVTGTTYTEIEALTGDETLVIPQGVTVDSLIIKKGAVEILGIVTNLTVDPAPIAGTDPVKYEKVVFRACEGLSEDVFKKIYSETAPVCNYIDPWYTYEKVGEVYNIVKRPVVAMIGEVEYKSLSDAFNAVPTGAAAAATVITVVADANETFKTRGAELKKGQKVILDLNGHKLVGTSMESGYTQYIYVENGGELTVKDSQTGGAIEYHDGYIENLTSGSGTGGSAITCHGCMTLESGTIENKTPDTKTNDLEGAIDMYTNAWGQAYSPADIVLNINGGVIKSNNANTVRLTSFSAQSYTTSVTVNMNGGEVYGRDGFFIQGVSESYLNTNTLNLNSGKVYGTQAVRVMAWQNHENASESKPVTIRIREGVDMKNNYFAQSTKTGWSEGICIDNLSGSFEQLLSYVNIITPVCKIDNSYFFSLSEAVTTVGAEETTITMLRDIKFTESVNIGTKKIILNTKGMNLDATGLRAIEINGGKLTVNGDGKFFAHNATGDNNAILNLYSGELVVNEVYLEGTNTCIGVTGGTATINNATMKALDGGCCVYASESGVINVNGMIFTCGGDDPDGPGACWAEDGGTVNVYGGTFNAVPLSNKTLEPEVLQANYCLYDYNDVTQYGYVPGHVNVYGGTFIDFNPANNYSGHSFLAAGYQSVQDGNKWIVSAINN